MNSTMAIQQDVSTSKCLLRLNAATFDWLTSVAFGALKPHVWLSQTSGAL